MCVVVCACVRACVRAGVCARTLLPPTTPQYTAVGPTRLTWFCAETDVLSSAIRTPRYFSVISCKCESIGPKWECAVRGNQRKWESA